MRWEMISKHVITVWLAVLFCLPATAWVTSCQKRDYPTASQQRKINKKLPYLEFKSGYTGVGELPDQDMPVILEAINRAKIKKMNGLWHMDITSPKNGNMSPAVFEYLQQIIENSNAIILKYRRSSKAIDPDKIIIR